MAPPAQLNGRGRRLTQAMSATSQSLTLTAPTDSARRGLLSSDRFGSGGLDEFLSGWPLVRGWRLGRVPVAGACSHPFRQELDPAQAAVLIDRHGLYPPKWDREVIARMTTLAGSR